MFRQTEHIEIAVAGITIALLAYIQIRVLPVDAADRGVSQVTVLAGISLTTLCALAGSFLARKEYRAGLLLLQFLAYLLLLHGLKGASMAAELMLLCLLVLHVSLRLSLVFALTADALILTCTTLVGKSVGSIDAVRIEVPMLGALFAFLAEIAVYYRERLVHAASTIDFQARSLENLTAANHSFVAHIESVEAESAERERLMITRELHDAIGYSMTNIVMMMNASRYLIDEEPEKLAEYCLKTKELASSTLQDTRRILYRLRGVAAQIPPSLPIFFARLCADFSRATGVRTDCHVGNLPACMEERVFIMLFRSVQVGFINALRHGNTEHIVLAFWLADTELRMRVWNDTRITLPDPEVAGEGIGLRGIRERLATVGGSLSYRPVIDGFEIVVTIPREETGLAPD